MYVKVLAGDDQTMSQIAAAVAGCGLARQASVAISSNVGGFWVSDWSPGQ